MHVFDNLSRTREHQAELKALTLEQIIFDVKMQEPDSTPCKGHGQSDEPLYNNDEDK